MDIFLGILFSYDILEDFQSHGFLQDCNLTTKDLNLDYYYVFTKNFDNLPIELLIFDCSNFYVLIEDENNFFKIVSSKNETRATNSKKIIVGENYKFRLKQLTDRSNIKSSEIPVPINYLDITRCELFDKTEICTESSFELAKAYNLNGLYILNN